jgi:hypothetical protein
MECGQRVTIWFLCKEGVSAKDIHPRPEAQFEEDTNSGAVSEGCVRVFGKDPKTYKAM